MKKDTNCNGSLIHRASTAGEENVHDYGHGEGHSVHAQCRADQNGSPAFGIVGLNLFQAIFCVRVRQVHQEDEAEENEEHGSDEGTIFAPHLKEGLWDEESQDNKCEPQYDLRAPISVLQGCAAVSGRLDAKEKYGEGEMEEPEPKVDSLNSNISIALFALTADGHVVERQVFQLLQSPRSEHEP